MSSLHFWYNNSRSWVVSEISPIPLNSALFEGTVICSVSATMVTLLNKLIKSHKIHHNNKCTPKWALCTNNFCVWHKAAFSFRFRRFKAEGNGIIAESSKLFQWKSTGTAPFFRRLRLAGVGGSIRCVLWKCRLHALLLFLTVKLSRRILTIHLFYISLSLGNMWKLIKMLNLEDVVHCSIQQWWLEVPSSHIWNDTFICLDVIMM